MSQEAVPWPSASWVMSAATHAMAAMEAIVSKLGREDSVGTAKVSECTPRKNSTLDGGPRKLGPRTGDLGWKTKIQDVIVGHSEAISGGLLSQHRLSNNVGVVNQYWRTLQHALVEERHFALVEICQANLGLASNRSGQELSPTQPSLRIEQDGEVPRGGAIDDASPGHHASESNETCSANRAIAVFEGLSS